MDLIGFRISCYLKIFFCLWKCDFYKFGWVQLLSNRFNEESQIVGKRVRALMPDFYIRFCYIRNYDLYKTKLLVESIRPDEELALKASAAIRPL